MAEFEEERIVRVEPGDPYDPYATRSAAMVRRRRNSLAPWLALASFAIVFLLVLLLIDMNQPSPTQTSSNVSSSVMAEHVTPTTVQVNSPPMPAQTSTTTQTRVSVPLPTKTVTRQVPGPTRTVTQQVPVPGPTQTVTQQVPVPGPTRTVTQQAPPPQQTASQSNTGTIALGTQAVGNGVIQDIDPDRPSITLQHEDLSSARLAHGIDTFKMRDASVLADLTTGDSVEFILVKTDEGWEVVSLSRAAH